MRVIVTGSRDWEGRAAEFEIHRVLQRLESLADTLGSKLTNRLSGFVDSPGPRLTIVHGGCPRGADAIVDRWARRRDYEPEIHAPDWKMGKSAGIFRNTYMVDLGADMCIGFIRNTSPGTLDCLYKASAAGIPTFPIRWEDTHHRETVEE